jgi:DNA-binding NarL/FixJ family response regulator
MSTTWSTTLQPPVPYNDGLAASIPGNTAMRPESPSDTLTAREMQVLRLMADGLSTKEIAVQLGITFKTAASHRSRILSKLGVHETVSAVRWAIRNSLILA